MKLKMEDILAAFQALNNGGVILSPTDTIWGLSCDAKNNQAVEKIISIKNRPANKSFIVLVPSMLFLEQLIPNIPLPVINFLNTCVVPTSFVLPAPAAIAPSVVAMDGTVAVRVCQQPFCVALMELLDKPLVSTSPNITGEPTPNSFEDIDEKIKKQVDFIVPKRVGYPQLAKPSDLAKWDGENIVYLRKNY